MNTITGLITILFAVIATINQSPLVPNQVKADITAKIVKAVSEAQVAKVAPTVPAGRTVLQNGTKTIEIGGPRKATQGSLAVLAVGVENADGTRTVSFVANDARYGEVWLYSQAPRGWSPVERQWANRDGQELFFIGSGSYKWTTASIDVGGRVIGTTTGRFIISDN